MKKRGFLTLNAIVRIALALILLFAAVSIGCELFDIILNKGEKAEESFAKIIPKITKLSTSTEGSSQSASVTMKEKSYIAFFGAGHENIHMISKSRYSFEAIVDQYFIRPNVKECTDTAKGCICLCLQYSTEEIEGTEFDVNIYCDSSICKEAGETDFSRPEITDASLMVESDLIADFYFEGGAIVQRDLFALGVKQQEIQAIFFEKGPGNLIGVCETRPCI